MGLDCRGSADSLLAMTYRLLEKMRWFVVNF